MIFILLINRNKKMSSQYEAACTILSLLKAQRIEGNITQGGISVYFKRRQRKLLLECLKGYETMLDFVEINLYVEDIENVWVKLLRKENNPLSISYETKRKVK